MAAKKRALGRGLGALIPSSSEPTESSRELGGEVPAPAPARVATGDVSVSGGVPSDDHQLLSVPARYRELPISAIVANPRQPRQIFDDEALAELVFSLREIGLLQPIVVRPTAQPDVFEIVAGERRWRAATQAGFETIPTIIRDTADDDLLRDALLENLHRANLNALEEAAAYQQLLDDFQCTQEELARRIGRSRPQVSNTIRLLRLPPDIARRVAAGVLSAGHARALLSLDDEQAMDALAHRIVAEGLSVRATEEIVAVGDRRTATKRKARRPKSTPIDVVELIERAADALDTRVTASSRRLIIEFGSVEDLRRIVETIEK